jgi:hypothetical protein
MTIATTEGVSRRSVLAGTGALLACALGRSPLLWAASGTADGATGDLLRHAAGSLQRPRLFHSVARGLAMIPGRAPVVAVAERGLHAIAARAAGAADATLFGMSSPERAATLVRTRFLGVVLDPWTMQPVEQHHNEITGTRLAVAPRRIDESLLIADATALVRSDGDGSAVRPRRISRADFGEETIVTSFEGAPPAPGARPAVTSISYRARTRDGSPGQPQVDFSMALMFAAEAWPWLGFPAAMRVQIMLNVTGKLIDSADSLDESFRSRLAAQDGFLSFTN